MTPSPDQAQNSQPDYSDQIEQLQESISRAQQTIRQIQNATGTGIGNTTPAKTKSGIDIPPVSGLAATIGNATVGSTVLQVTWIDAPQPTGATIDHYNVYTQSAFGAQTKPTLVGASKQSPCVCSIQPSGNVSITIFVQTVLSNGQSLALSKCPSTTIVGSKLGPSVIVLLQGYVPQQPATITIAAANAPITSPTNVLTVSNGTGGALQNISFRSQGLSGSSSPIGVRVTIDGSATTMQFMDGPGAYTLAYVMQGVDWDSGVGTVSWVPYPYGFATSLKVDITSSGVWNSGSLQSVVGYALHT